MTNYARYTCNAALFLALVVAGGTAEADSITPVGSSVSLTANAQSGFVPLVTDTDSQSQGSTINPLSVAVSAYSAYPPFDASLLVTGNGSATWTSPSTGEVAFTDCGWTGMHASGVAYLFNSSQFLTEFLTQPICNP